jgi:predicted lipoprotein with Yx(FWY)xxD motif
MIRSNGARQVTWNEHPLYRFVSDTKGKVTGNGVAGFVAARAGTSWKMTSTTTTSGGYSY